MNAEGVEVGGEDVVPSTERCRRLEDRCVDLQDQVDELLLRVEALERNRAPSGPSKAPPDGKVATATAKSAELDGAPFDRSMVEPPIEPDGKKPKVDAVDALLAEAEAMGQGQYDEDLKEIINMYTSPRPADEGAGFGPADEVASDLRQLLQEPAFRVTLVGEAVPGSGAAATTRQTPHPAPEGRLHLIIGDSLAVGLKFAVGAGDYILNLAIRGNTWNKERKRVREHVEQWRDSASDHNLSLGRIFVWLGGNDVYGRPHDTPVGLCQDDVGAVLAELQSYDLLLAGPTPRLWCDAGARYEDTAAFRADLPLREAALARGLRFLPYLGRALTCMVKRRHLVRSDVASRWFSPDAAHPRPVVIDTDPGVDDAQAIGMVLAADRRRELRLIAICVTFGNSTIEHCTRNARRILGTFNRLDIPIYSGAHCGLVNGKLGTTDLFHGSDGLGDTEFEQPPPPLPRQSEHAAAALTRLAREHKGELAILALAPLTTVALATRLDPEFSSNVGDIVIMGGNFTGKVAATAVSAAIGAQLRPVQLGVATRNGCEAAVHATRAYIDECEAAPDTEINTWYLDDGTLAGPPSDVISSIKQVKAEMSEVGLAINAGKCEVTFLGGFTDDTKLSALHMLQSVLPDIREVPVDEREVPRLGRYLRRHVQRFVSQGIRGPCELSCNRRREA
ncbi:uncharacterized protein LOC122366463 [Amphibalanus amphitrite]|uniref:uncharacterized protein LOC122366463 n=1 Tax=Amphibalanus amphitrite TaxID=1232801 RepID=UPI001C8FADE5|nr:uncharacterized protein LOC122366463 [Amphibalanus amphitrite]